MSNSFIAPAVVIALLAAPIHAESMKLTVQQIQNISIGLAGMDAPPKAITVDGQTKLVPSPYDFPKGVRDSIVRDKIAADAVLTAQKERFDKFVSGVKGAADADTQAAAENVTIMTSEQEVNLIKFKLSDFNLDANGSLPGSYVADLAPIITDSAAQ